MKVIFAKMQKVYNFNAGPAMLPVEVMQKAQDEFLNYKNSGMSIMEVSHRGKHFEEVLNSADKNLRNLLSIPENYSVAFFPGGATFQFSAVPMNLIAKEEHGDYSLTGVWSVKAFQEAKKLGYGANCIFDGKEIQYSRIPKITEENISKDSKYLFITSNNTIYGSCYKKIPDVSSVPMIADMTSDLLSRKIDVSKFAYIFAGAQKNIGPSGLTVGIIRNDLLEMKKGPVPVLLDFKQYFGSKSLYNTPPTFSIYIANLVFEWCLQKGGLEVIEKENDAKAELLYTYLENSNLYTLPIEKNSRSNMNVVFHLKDKSLEKKFIDESELLGLHGLAGHRDAGGMRASIYNAMPIKGVETLIEFLKTFEEKNA
ncbi:MAG: 3-phosphoserine/phosphohydroxythreonine transaminase [Leptospiraceae bacterium]|nr:3-phosphoserine/phosphohydroxythreonine transaminase [Leptospiraceae bacterium]